MGEEPPATAPRRDPSPGSSKGSDVECGGCGGRRGVESGARPLHPPVPALRISPPSPSSPRRAHPGLRALEGAGIPGHRSLWGRPSAPGQTHLPTSALAPGGSTVVPGASGAGFLRLSACARLTPSPERAGDRVPPPPRTGGRGSQSETSVALLTSPGGVAMTLTPPSPYPRREMCPGVSIPGLWHT